MKLVKFKNGATLLITLLLAAGIKNQAGFSQIVEEKDIRTYHSAQNFSYPNSEERFTFQSLPPNFEYNRVRCIIKDHKGYMWFGTEDGLIRYDGINLYVYENDQDDSTSLSHKSVNAIVEDTNNNLWVGTSMGLNLYSRDLDNFIRVGNLNANISRLNDNYISALCADNEGLLWIGTFGDGVNVYDPEKQRVNHYSYNNDDPNTLSSNRITCIASDSEDNIWLGTQNGLYLFSEKDKGFRQFYSEKGKPESLSSNNITSLTVDLEGNLWAGTMGGGLNKLEKKNNEISFKHYYNSSREGSLSSNFILSLNADRKGNLWIGTDNGGLNLLQTGTDYFRVFQVEEGVANSISSNSIWSLYSDNEGRLWIGTYNRGINVIDEKFSKFESYQKNIVNKYSLTDNDVTGFVEDSHGNIWIATDGGGICRFNPLTRQFNKIILNSDGHKYLANNAIKAILFDSKGNLWVGTWAGGIDRLNENGVKIENYKIESKQGAGNNNILSLYEDSKGNVWAGTAGIGLFKYNAGTNTFEQIECSNPSRILNSLAFVTSILEDSDGNLWVGTLFGIVILKGDPDQKYTCVNFSWGDNIPSLSSNMIEVIFEDKKKRLWLGTGDYGLNLFNKEDSTSIVLQKEDGLPSNSIRGILEDDEGYLWITTNGGVCRFNYDSLSFTNYTREDGLNSNEFYLQSCLRTKKGEFYMGGENGFNVFYPENIRNNNVIPPVYLTNLKINNISAEIGLKDSPLKKHIGEISEIILNHKQSSFTIEFVALNYTRSARNQFSYKFEGFDAEWNYADNNRNASYTNIKPGKYWFMVKGSNNDGIWNNTPTTLLIRIKPPLWKTWWAILTYIVLISVLVAVSLIVWNERIKIKHQLRLEQLGREKEHELNEANIQFFTNISHEFRTPLSLIIAPLESIILSAHSKIKEQLVVIYQNAQRLLHLTNNLMDFRKLEEGRTNLKVKYGNIISFIREVASYFNVNFKRRHINFTIDASETDIKGWFDPEKLETILLNLLSNASKFTPDGGKIQIFINSITAMAVIEKYNISLEEIHDTLRYIEIRVIDSGSGISPEDLPFVFEKFYQTNSLKKKKNSGTGIGLALTKGLIELNHGGIIARSVPNLETCLSFVLPIEQSSFLEDEIVNEPTSVIGRTIVGVQEKLGLKKHGNNHNNTDNRKERAVILIVEDNFDLRIFLASELSEKYTIIQAEDGEPGIELAFKKIPDLIISDILMPQCSGIELCNVLKTDIRTCHIPIILLTAKTTISEQIEGVEIGADAYLTKPFNMQFLEAKINQLVQSRRKLYAHFSQDVYIMPNKITDNEMDQQFIQKTIDYIVLNIANDTLYVEGLASEMSMSRSNVYRKIKALTGKTIIEFITNIRLKQSIKLMEMQKYSLTEIAYMVGFTSLSYFTKCFKKQYGKPPSKYLT